ncbi:MAG: hypothetical protein WBO45_13820, partial [Planctomycetota bacterium]
MQPTLPGPSRVALHLSCAALLAACGGRSEGAATHPALRLALVPPTGTQPIDEQIRGAQQAVQKRADVLG